MEWISVEERLPDPTIPVLVTGKTYLDRFHNKLDDSYLTPSVCRYFSDGRWLDDLHDDVEVRDWIKITHWAPLPKLPKD